MILNFGDPDDTISSSLVERPASEIRVIEDHHDGFVVRGALLAPGFELHGGEYVRSPQHCEPGTAKYKPDGYHNLVMQPDGDLVLYEGPYGSKGGNAVWHAGTSGHPGAFFVVQGDGNIVIYDSSMKPLWSSGTGNRPSYRFWVQSDGNLTIYDTNGETWGPNGRSGPYRAWTREPGATFWQTVGAIAAAIPAIAIAPIALPTAALISLAATPVTGDPFKIVTDVSKYSATHPLETIAITAGAAGAAYGVGLIAPAIIGSAGTVAGATGAVAGTGVTVAKAAGALPSGSTKPAATPSTQVVNPSTSPALQAGMADLKTPIAIIAGAGLLTFLLFGRKGGRK